MTGSARRRKLGQPLTEREQQVLLAVADGRSSAEAGYDLGVTELTIKAHLANVYKKLGARDRVHAVTLGLVGPGQVVQRGGRPSRALLARAAGTLVLARDIEQAAGDLRLAEFLDGAAVKLREIAGAA